MAKCHRVLKTVPVLPGSAPLCIWCIRTNSWAAESAPKPSDKSEDKSGKPTGKPAGKGTMAVSFPIRKHKPLTLTLREQVYQSDMCYVCWEKGHEKSALLSSGMFGHRY